MKFLRLFKHLLLVLAFFSLAYPSRGWGQSSPSVSSLVLLNAATGQPIATLTNGAVFNLSSLPTTSLAVAALTSPATVGSVRFGLNNTPSYRIENSAPYALQGDSNGTYYSWMPTPGAYTISATPYTQASAQGIAGTTVTVNINFVQNGATPSATPSPTPSVIPSPTPSATALPTGTVTAVPTSAPATTLRYRSGLQSYTGSDGRVWQSDGGIVIGATSTYSVTSPIAGTIDDALYQTERFGGNFAYEIPVPNGNYRVNLHFAEIYWTVPNERLFNVALEGSTLLQNFDVFAAQGSLNASFRQFSTSVADGSLSVDFTTLKDFAKISAIEIVSLSSGPLPTATPTPVTSPTPVITPSVIASPTPVVTATPLPTAAPATTLRYRTGPQSYTGTDGRVWQSDQGIVTGATSTYSVTSPIDLTIDDPLYQTERFGPTFAYQIPVTNGNYRVILHFAEIYWTVPNERLFNVAVEGASVLQNFDIFQAVGSLKASTRQFTTTVADGALSIAFATVKDFAKISAIEVESLSVGPLPTATPTSVPSSTPIVSPVPTITATPVVTVTPTPVPTNSPGTVQFLKQTVATASTTGLNQLVNPTSLDFGPDGRLYVSQQDGRLYALTLNASRQVTNVQVINTIRNSVTYNEVGTIANNAAGRQVTGIYLDPKSPATAPVLYVSHSDPRIGVNNNFAASIIDTDGGVLTRLVGPDFDLPANRRDLIVGLPRSRENHSPNGIQVGQDGWLYLSIGGNTNYGAPSLYFSDLPEVNLSAVIVRANLSALQSGPPLNVSAGSQAGSVAGSGEIPGIFEVYATGYRNAYDILWHSNGKFYANLNAGNNGLGNTPGPLDGCPDGASVNPGTPFDTLDLVVPGGYGGHPHPARKFCVYGNGSIYSPPKTPSSQFVPHLFFYQGSSSANGMAEYTSQAFGGQMFGNVISAVTYGTNPDVRRVVLNATGTSVVSSSTIASGLSGPIDVAIRPDGTIYVAEFFSSVISALVPASGGTTGDNDGDGIPDSSDPDDDNDGYSDVDEIANGSNPLNPASVPLDADKDFIGDATDPDDDNDALLDTQDQFMVDSSNGLSTLPPLNFEWNPGDAILGGLKRTGFTGAQLPVGGAGWDPSKVNVGAAGGFMSIVPSTGDSLGSQNSLMNALQIGFDARPSLGIGTFTIKGRLTQPFASPPVPPVGKEGAGIFVGQNQDNFVRVGLMADTGSGVSGIQVVAEINGATTLNALPAVPLAIPQNGNVDFFITVYPTTQSIGVWYQTTGASPTLIGTLTNSTVVGLSALFNSQLGGGVFATKAGSASSQFVAVYDFFEAFAGAPINPPSSSSASARFEVRTNDLIGVQTTYAPNSFLLYNTSTGGQSIARARFNLKSAILPDIVFDPTGTGGDTSSKPFTLDTNVGVQSVAGKNLAPHEGGGFDVLDIVTSGFDSSDSIGFSIDLDPTSIKGLPGPGPSDSGSIGAAELVGSSITVFFSDGTTFTSYLAPATGVSNFGVATALLNSTVPLGKPLVSLVGNTGTDVLATTANQNLFIVGEPSSSVRIYQANGGLFIQGAGYDIDPFEANSVTSASIFTATIGSGGTITIPVTIPIAPSISHFVATVVGSGGATGPTSSVLKVRR